MEETTQNQLNNQRPAKVPRTPSSVKIEVRTPTPQEYAKLREVVNWSTIDLKAIEHGLQNSIFSVCATYEQEVIGCGRVIGDGGIYFYIQDIIVVPAFQKRGIGKFIMNEIMKYLNKHAAANAFIGLMSSEGVMGFYEKYGFEERPNNGPGMFRTWQKRM